jgi:class 3 adenylate cyclase
VVGLTVKVPPVILNALIPAALGVITTEVPEQMVALFTDITGSALTVKLPDEETPAPQPFIPATLYV